MNAARSLARRMDAMEEDACIVSCPVALTGKYGRAGMLLPGWFTDFMGCGAPGQLRARPFLGTILCGLVLPPS